MKEIWKDIIGYETRYQISNMGRVKSIRKNYVGGVKYLKQKLEYNKYYFVTLFNGKKYSPHKIHRIVAKHFVDNPNHLYTHVDHIDNNPKNNIYTNLRWCTLQQNSRFDNRKKPHHSSKYVGVHISKNRKKWKTDIRRGGNKIHLGTYNTEEEARDVYLKAVEDVNYMGSIIKSNNKYKNVVYHKKSKKYMARFNSNGIVHYLGLFINEEEANKQITEYKLKNNL
jgi:hypothetical protein